MESLLLFLVGILSLAAIYVVLCLALNLEAGIDGLWDLGIVSFFGIGAYTYVLLTAPAAEHHQNYVLGLGLPIWIGVVAAGVMGGIVALLIGIPSLRLKREYFLITTLAFAEVIRQEAEDLRDAGARYIQIDEPAVSTRMDELELAIKALGVVTSHRSTPRRPAPPATR